MSERIDVNAAFDPELRQAQKDMDDYVNSRPETDEGAVDVLETQGTYVDAIDRAIAADPRLRRMAMLANEIREIGDKTVTVKDAEQLSRMHNDKQDKLAELLQEYQDSDSAPEIESKDDVINRIIDRTQEAPADKLPANKAEAKESEADDDKDNSDSTGKPEEEKPAEKEKPEEASSEKEGATSEAITEEGKQEAQPRKSEKVSDDEFDQNDMDELRKKLDAEDAAGEYKPKHRAEFSDEDTPLFDAVKSDLAKSGEAASEADDKQSTPEVHPAGGRHVKTGAAGLEILEEGGDSKKVDAKDLEILEEDKPADNDRSGIRVRDWLRHPLASAGGALAGAGAKAEHSGENNDRSRRKKRLAGFILFGSAIGGGLLMMKGHNPFDHSTHGVLDNLPTVPEVVPPAGTDPNVPPADGIDIIKSIRVNPGDGEIKVTQNILDQMGIHVSAADAQRIGEHAHVDLLAGDHNYDDAGSTLNRVGGGPGVYNIRPGSVEALVQSAKELGLDK